MGVTVNMVQCDRERITTAKDSTMYDSKSCELSVVIRFACQTAAEDCGNPYATAASFVRLHVKQHSW